MLDIFRRWLIAFLFIDIQEQLDELDERVSRLEMLIS